MKKNSFKDRKQAHNVYSIPENSKGHFMLYYYATNSRSCREYADEAQNSQFFSCTLYFPCIMFRR